MTNKSEIKPDFTRGAIDYRRRHATVRGEALARAAGLKKGFRPIVLDATAGFGQDSFILAALGCDVYLFERCPGIHALLEEGLMNARTDSTLAPIIARMHLSLGDTKDALDHLPVTPDVIYLDPMFPEKTKSGAVRKEMQHLQSLAGPDTDSDTLLLKALSCAPRIVVKRPRLSPCLAGLKPDFTLTGTSSRFDVYLRRNPHGNTAVITEPDSPP